MTHLNLNCEYEHSNYQPTIVEFVFEYEPQSDHDPLHYDDYHAVLSEDLDGSACVEDIYFYDTEGRQVGALFIQR